METAALKKLDKYDIVGILGKGATGTVYEGYDPIIERRVAIKTVSKHALDDSEADELLRRFKREAQAAGRLNHPGVVSIYDYGETGDVAFIAMEFIKGKELKKYFDAGERFETKDIVRIMCQILEALDHAHCNGVKAHRDIKPANIMITDEGRVKVADFGVARIESSMMTQVGTRLGTPAYMSPEQHQALSADARSDVFSCGVILYQFLTGERPFTGGGYTIIQQILKQDPIPPSEINFTLPRAFDMIVAKALAKRPDERFISAKAFAEALRHAASGESPSGSVAVDFARDGPDAGTSTPAGMAAGAAGAGGMDEIALEREFWEEIKDSGNAADLSAFIEAFPTSKRTHIARSRLRRLESAPAPATREANGGGSVLHPGKIASSQENGIEQTDQARREAVQGERHEAENRKRKEAEEKARRAVDARKRQDAENRTRRAAEEQARREAEEEAQCLARDRARREAEEKAHKDAEERALKDVEAKAAREAEEARQRELEDRERKAAETRARREAEARANREAAETARREAEARRLAAEQVVIAARQKAEEKAKRDEMEMVKRDAQAVDTTRLDFDLGDEAAAGTAP